MEWLKRAGWHKPKGKKSTFLQGVRQNKEGMILLLPFLVMFAVFNIIPVLANIFFSFTYFNGLEWPEFVGIANYKRLFMDDEVYGIAFRNTMVFSVITGPVSYLMCFFFAWLINELTPKFRALLTVVFYAPSITGSIYVIWTLLFSGDMYGYVNSILLRLNIIAAPVQWLTDPVYMLTIVIIVQLWLSLGTGFLAFIAGFKGLDKALFEAGAMDGVKNRFQELWFITLPQLRPILILGAVLQITAAFSVSAVPIALTGFPSTDYATHTIVSHMLDYGTIRFEVGYASAIGTMLSLIMLGTNKIIQVYLNSIGD